MTAPSALDRAVAARDDDACGAFCCESLDALFEIADSRAVVHNDGMAARRQNLPNAGFASGRPPATGGGVEQQMNCLWLHRPMLQWLTGVRQSSSADVRARR